MESKRTIFVFGSNREGRHGKGAALEARLNWGAKNGYAAGLVGNSYGIITKELRPWAPKVTLAEINNSVKQFLYFAKMHPELEFRVTPIGCGLAGFKVEEIAPMFGEAFGFNHPNVQLPPEFTDWLRLYNDPYKAILGQS